MRSSYVWTWCVYGLIVVASGCWRYFSKPAGEKGLWFGLTLGAVALLAAALLRAGRTRAGHVAGFTSLAFVTGWFSYESLVKNGGSHEVRLLLVAGLSLVQAAIAVAHLGGRRGAAA